MRSTEHCSALLVGSLLLVGCVSVLAADEPSSAVAPVMKLLKSGRVPEQRLSSIVEIVGTRGNEHDLAFLFERAAQGDWPVPLRVKALSLLEDAAKNRKVVPAGDLAPLAGLIDDPQSAADLRTAAVRLAGAVAAVSTADALDRLARDAQAPLNLRTSALESLVSVAAEKSRPAIDALLEASQPFEARSRAVAALAKLDLDAAAKASAGLLAAAGSTDDPSIAVDALLDRKNGADRLAAAIVDTPPSADVAKLALRHMYSIGRNDDSLVSALSKLAGLDAELPPLTPERIATLVTEVEQQGDAARGEAVFRRADLSCMKCHAVSAAGGQVGPDLSAVGSISPIDFLINAVMNPDLAIKEAYITRVVQTVDGLVVQGIVVDRSDERIVLKDATGMVHTIAMADVDQEVEGKSLMPKGLVKFMTHQEFLDVVKFLSQLGRPGEYAIRATPRFQRYRVLAATPTDLAESIPNDEQFEATVLRSPNWTPIYARVNGVLPLEEAERTARSPVVWLSTELEVTKAGPIGLAVDSTQGLTAWLDDNSLSLKDGTTIEPAEGRHRITLRVDRAARGADDLRLELVRQPGSAAEFRPVDGM